MDSPSKRALQCGRRMFLASLILASKYLQDRNFSSKAWSKISSLSVSEINRNEMAFLNALDYKLHFKSDDFQKWNELVKRCTDCAHRGLPCPWMQVLEAMELIHKLPESGDELKKLERAIDERTHPTSESSDVKHGVARAKTMLLPCQMQMMPPPMAMLRGLAQYYGHPAAKFHFRQPQLANNAQHSGLPSQCFYSNITSSPETLSQDSGLGEMPTNLEHPSSDIADATAAPISPPATPQRPRRYPSPPRPSTAIANGEAESGSSDNESLTMPPAPRPPLMPSPSITPELEPNGSAVSPQRQATDGQMSNRKDREDSISPNGISAMQIGDNDVDVVSKSLPDLGRSGPRTNTRWPASQSAQWEVKRPCVKSELRLPMRSAPAKRTSAVAPDDIPATNSTALESLTRRCLAPELKSFSNHTNSDHPATISRENSSLNEPAALNDGSNATLPEVNDSDELEQLCMPETPLKRQRSTCKSASASFKSDACALKRSGSGSGSSGPSKRKSKETKNRRESSSHSSCHSKSHHGRKRSAGWVEMLSPTGAVGCREAYSPHLKVKVLRREGIA